MTIIINPTLAAAHALGQATGAQVGLRGGFVGTPDVCTNWFSLSGP